MPLLQNRGIAIPHILVAGAIVAVLTATGFEMLPSWNVPDSAVMRLEPREKIFKQGDIFTETLFVDASTPVNVFSGELTFNEDVVQIQSIEYNTSIADLWAEKPWYENGRGTMNFGGGTTRPGGFIGTGNLISVVFQTIGVGDAEISLTNARILKHDGLGTDVPQPPSIDTILSVIDVPPVEVRAAIAVAEDPPSLDLNSDGKVTIVDASILMLNLVSRNPRYDLNLDGDVNMKDFDLIVAEAGR